MSILNSKSDLNITFFICVRKFCDIQDRAVTALTASYFFH